MAVHAYVGYIAGKRILGISKLTRLVRLFAQRFTVQERKGPSPVHGDAGRAGGLAQDPHDLLAG